MVEHLDYLVDLGINAIYFNPIFQSGSNHRYHTHDYFQVDPMLGGNAALRELLDAAHARGIRVVLDGVFNHASRGFFQFHDILENGAESAYLDWFTVHEWPLRPYGSKQPNYAAWWGNPALPKFNTEHAGGARVHLRRRALLDRVRHRRLAAGCAGRDRRRQLLAGVPPGGARPRTPKPTSWARSGTMPSAGCRATSSTR